MTSIFISLLDNWSNICLFKSCDENKAMIKLIIIPEEELNKLMFWGLLEKLIEFDGDRLYYNLCIMIPIDLLSTFQI